MAQWRFVEWLLVWLLRTRNFQFEWDQGNSTKNFKKHNVSTEEAESVFILGSALPLGVQVQEKDKKEEDRLGLIGMTKTGKILQIAFVIRKKKVRIISARPANKKEKRVYEETIRKIFKDL